MVACIRLYTFCVKPLRCAGMRAFEAVAAALTAAGVKAGFTLMSEDTARLIVELRRGGVEIYSTRHEAAAIGMAHGYARASGSIGLAIVGRGPGLTNALTLLINAAKDGPGTGLLVLAGDTSVRDAAATPPGAGQLKYIDQSALLDAVGVPNLTLRSAATAVADLEVACARAKAGGTVVVNLPVDVAMAEAGTAASAIALPPLPLPSQPAADDVLALADLLEEAWAARRPLILAGRGAVLSGAGPALRLLADRIGALLSTTLLAASLFRDDAYDLGVLGTVERPAATELAPQADVVLAFGASLQPTTTWRGETIRGARVLHVDADPGAFGRNSRADLGVLGDARLVAEALVAELDRRGHRVTGWRTSDIAARIAELRGAQQTDAVQRGVRPHPKVLMRELDRVLPATRALVIETGQCLSFTAGELSVRDPESFYFPHGFGTIGASLGFALGVALARPDRPTVYAGGDGSYVMTAADLDTAVRYRLPVVFIICNDGGFGAEVQMLRVNGVDSDLARYDNPSFAAMALAAGADGITIAALEDVDVLRTRLAVLDGPLVVDCLVDPEAQANWVEFFFAEPRSATAS